MKTKRVLKNWVKVTITSFVVITAITMIIAIDSSFNKKEINKCVAAGHTEIYCIAHS